ncbi:hypothetical protein CR513_14409, partial [Mucuna pruriens]
MWNNKALSKSTVKRNNVGKGSRQNGSVTSEKRLAYGKRIGSEGWARGSQSRTRRLSVDCSSCSRGTSWCDRVRARGALTLCDAPRHGG